MPRARKLLLETFKPHDADLKRRTINSSYWSGLSVLTRVLLSIITIPILTRLISPEDFGIVTLATVATEIVALFGEFGLQAALIQRKFVYRYDLDTAFWADIAVGFGLALILFLTAATFAEFFDEVALATVLKVSAIGLIIINISSVHQTILVRTMRFKIIAIVEIISSLSRSISGIVLAWQGNGYWSLVIAGIIGFSVTGTLRFFLVPWWPRMRFRSKRFTSMFRFGRNLLVDNLLHYFSNNLDYMIVGRRLGAQQLGYYEMAYAIPNMVKSNLAQVITRVLFPSFSRVKDDTQRMNAAFIQVVKILSIIAFPALSGLLIIAPEFVPLYFGPQWLPVILPLQMLCVSGALIAVTASFGPIIHAKGRPDVTMKLAAIKLPLLATVLWIGSSYGINGTAIGFMSLNLVWVIVSVYVTSSTIGANPMDVMKAFLPGLTSAFLMGLCVLFLSHYLDSFVINSVIQLLIEIFSGIIIFLLVLYFLWPRELKKVISLVRTASR